MLVRVNSSTWVNTLQVQSVTQADGGSVHLQNHHQVPIGDDCNVQQVVRQMNAALNRQAQAIEDLRAQVEYFGRERP